MPITHDREHKFYKAIPTNIDELKDRDSNQCRSLLKGDLPEEDEIVTHENNGDNEQ